MDPIVLNIILVVVLVAIIGLAVLYIYKSKKAGAVCIGCPYAKQCGKKSSGCSCGNSNGNNKSSGGDSCCH